MRIPVPEMHDWRQGLLMGRFDSQQQACEAGCTLCVTVAGLARNDTQWSVSEAPCTGYLMA